MASEVAVYVVALGVVVLAVLGMWVSWTNSENPILSIVVAGVITLISLLYAVERITNGQTAR
jgi:hypothetical protein